MIYLCKQFDFDAAHFLPRVAADHKCRRLHGHTYRVDVVLCGQPDENGMLIDYADVAEAWSPVDAMLDHRCLNDIEGLENPTTEVLAQFIVAMLVDALPLLDHVRVYESSTTWCEAYR